MTCLLSSSGIKSSPAFLLQWVLLLWCFTLLAACSTRSNPGAHSAFEGLAPATQKISVSGHRDTLVHLPSGARLFIPAKAFITSKGKPVSGKIALEIREFSSTAEMLLANAPTEIGQSNEGKSGMASDCMIEVRSSRKGQTIAIREDRPLRYSAAANIAGDFDLYRWGHPAETESTAWELVEQRAPNPKWEVPDGKTLLFDTVQKPATRHLVDLPFSISALDGGAPPDWLFEEEWTSLELTRPSFAAHPKHHFNSRGHFRGAYTIRPFNTDSSWFQVVGKDSALCVDWNGKVVRTYAPIQGEGGWFTPKSNFIDRYEYYNYALFTPEHAPLVLTNIDDLRLLADEQTLVYRNRNKSNEEWVVFEVRSIDGTVVQTIRCRPHPARVVKGRTSRSKVRLRGSDRSEGFLIHSGNGVAIYDKTGQRLSTTPRGEQFADAFFCGSLNLVLLEYLDGNFEIWNWKTNQKIPLPIITDGESSLEYRFHWEAPLILFYQEAEGKIWLYNWETRSMTDLSVPFPLYQTGFSYGRSTYIEMHSADSTQHVLKNLRGKSVIVQTTQTGLWAPFLSVEKGKYWILESSNGIRLFDRTGKLLRDFTLELPNWYPFFLKRKRFYVTDAMGNLQLIAADGEVTNSFMTQVFTEPYDYWQSDTRNMAVYNQAFNSHKHYAPSGQLVYALGSFEMQGLRHFQGQNIALGWSHIGGKVLFELQPATYGPNEYQISLLSAGKTFTGRVQVDGITHQQIGKYTHHQLKHFAEEQAAIRIPGQKIIPYTPQRQMVLGSFGYYRWARPHHQPESVTCTVEVSATSESASEPFQVFLIRGENGSSVVQYEGPQLNNFSFYPGEANRLLAVFPGNRVAYLSPSAFQEQIANKANEGALVQLRLPALKDLSSLQALQSLLESDGR